MFLFIYLDVTFPNLLERINDKGVKFARETHGTDRLSFARNSVRRLSHAFCTSAKKTCLKWDFLLLPLGKWIQLEFCQLGREGWMEGQVAGEYERERE
jgi:RNase P protein component